MQISIISTYPASGSKNIGDKLIEESTINLLKEVLSVSEFKTIWREEIEENLEIINQSSLVVYACLAIRDEMFPKVYNLPKDLSKIKPPMLAIASGTKLNPKEIERCELGYEAQYDQNTINTLHKLSSKMLGISCRGELTYAVLRKLGLKNISMTGDIAFLDSRFDNFNFDYKNQVNKIAVSTPHNPKFYKEHFHFFLASLRKEFPQAEIYVLLHGITDWIDQEAIEKLNCTIKKLYEYEEVDALDIYSEMDAHIGYRVHAHVSALKRRIPSYLFAIDGRGIDYGKTLLTGTTVKAWQLDVSRKPNKASTLVKSLIKEKLLKRRSGENTLSVKPNFNAIDYLINLLKRDLEENMVRFIGFEKSILQINRRVKDFLIEATATINF